LGCGQPCAAGGGHGVAKVLEQLEQLRGAELLHRLRHLQEPGVAHFENGF